MLASLSDDDQVAVFTQFLLLWLGRKVQFRKTHSRCFEYSWGNKGYK